MGGSGGENTRAAGWKEGENKEGRKGVVVGTGPVVENICNSPISHELEIWLVSVFPFPEIPEGLLSSINSSRRLVIMEEHNGECGLRETLSYHLINELTSSIQILSLAAKGYPSGRYGDQKWHQHENNLGGAGMDEAILKFLTQK